MSTPPVIIHQMAKVGSTAIQLSLQQYGIETLQTHHLGRSVLQGILHEHLSSVMSLEQVKHEMHLFTDQVIATKHIYLSQQQQQAQPLKLITLSREPVERWFSSLVQNYTFHLNTAKKFYALESLTTPDSDLQCFDYALGKILFILENSPYSLGTEEFSEYLLTTAPTRSVESGSQLKILGDELLTPFYWFQNNGRFLDIDFFNGSPIIHYQHFQTPHLHVLLVKYEFLKDSPAETEKLIENFLDLETFSLCQANVSKEKTGFDIIKTIKEKYYSRFINLKCIKQSAYCQHFSYSA